MKKRGNFIVFEGINGSGKGYCNSILDEYLHAKGLKSFNLSDFEKKENKFAELNDVKGSNYLVSSEPTYAWVGAAIRQEAFYENGRDYPPVSMMNAYALDRHFHYRRIIVPALEAGIHVIQERSFGTSLAFQTTGKNKVTFRTIAEHPDHQLVFQNLPDLVILIDISAERCLEFMSARKKIDNDIFERLEQQNMHRKQYLSEQYQDFFKSKNIRLEIIKNDGSLEELKEKCLKIVTPLFSNI